MKDIVILVPVYNDVECLHVLQNHSVFDSLNERIAAFIVVNDGSETLITPDKGLSFPVKVISLRTNLGHQKALAIGLSYINKHIGAEKVVIMDADGEDGPDDIFALLQAAGANPSSVIVAKRAGRREGFAFQAGYQMYRTLFRALTGYRISSGNFMLIPHRYLSGIVFKNDIWNHLAAAIIKSKLPVVGVPVTRQKRFLGASKMNFTRLIIHGLGAITVFVDFVSARLFIGSFVILVLTAAAIATIILIKLLTDLAIPGWASVLTGVMFIIFLQSFLVALSTVVLYLSSQSQRQFIPGAHFEEFIVKDEGASYEG